MKNNRKYLEDYARYLKLRNFANATCKTYVSGLRHFLEFRDQNDIRGPLSQDQAIQFLNFTHDQGKSWSLFNCIYSALRKYFREVLDIEWSVKKLPRPRKDRILPEIISEQEVVQLIEHATIYKHQVLITLLYATGLRLSEVLHLRIEHIHGDRKQIFVHKGKGHKDRYVHIPECLLQLLRNYFLRYRPEVYLFNGIEKGKSLSPSAAQWAIRSARHRAGLLKKTTTHTLRHCYATHHLEAGTNLIFIQHD